MKNEAKEKHPMIYVEQTGNGMRFIAGEDPSRCEGLKIEIPADWDRGRVCNVLHRVASHVDTSDYLVTQAEAMGAIEPETKKAADVYVAASIEKSRADDTCSEAQSKLSEALSHINKIETDDVPF